MCVLQFTFKKTTLFVCSPFFPRARADTVAVCVRVHKRRRLVAIKGKIVGESATVSVKSFSFRAAQGLKRGFRMI